MKQRTITAFFFTAAMLGGIYGGKYSFYGLFALITAVCSWELGGLVFKEESGFVTFRKLLCAGVPTLLFAFFGGEILGIISMSPIPILACLLFLFPALATVELFLAGKTPFANIGAILLAICYITLPLVLLTDIVYVALEDYAPNRVLGLLLLVWTNDVGAYLVGSRYGKHKLLERISPKKTWEGTIGGGILALLAAWGLSYLMLDFTFRQWLVLSMVAAIGSNLGDLVESMFKRSVGVKDSGSILPGHGGFLDRFDAFIFCVPFYWLVLQLV